MTADLNIMSVKITKTITPEGKFAMSVECSPDAKLIDLLGLLEAGKYYLFRAYLKGDD